MAHLLRFLILAFLFFPVAASATVWTGTGPAPAGYTDLAGWIKGADGVSSRAFSDGNGTRATPTNNTVSVTSNALVNTSKGQHLMQITKTAIPDLPRVGSAVGALMKQVGPVGMTVAAVSLVCELTTICEQAGQWFTSGDPDYPDYPSSSPYERYITGSQVPSNAPLPELSCAKYMTVNTFPPGWTSELTSPTQCTIYNSTGGISSQLSVIKQVSVCATGYEFVLASNNCLATFAQPGPATAADIDAKAPLLNDERLVPELQAKDRDIPTGIPTLTPGQKKELGVDSVPTKDPEGNITGREDTTTELEPIDAGTADKPGLVIIKETKTTVKYDTNNTQISTTTSTSYSSQPQPEAKPTEYEIKFDGVDPVTLPAYDVPNTYASTSWGDGTCPADIELNLSLGQFAIPSSPICDTAEMINPFVLALSALFSIYIIAGVRASNS